MRMPKSAIRRLDCKNFFLPRSFLGDQRTFFSACLRIIFLQFPICYPLSFESNMQFGTRVISSVSNASFWLLANEILTVLLTRNGQYDECQPRSRLHLGNLKASKVKVIGSSRPFIRKLESLQVTERAWICKTRGPKKGKGP